MKRVLSNARCGLFALLGAAAVMFSSASAFAQETELETKTFDINAFFTDADITAIIGDGVSALASVIPFVVGIMIAITVFWVVVKYARRSVK